MFDPWGALARRRAPRPDPVALGEQRMSEDTPSLLPSGQDLYQWTHVANALSLLVHRMAANRTHAGRMAYDNAEQSTLSHLARELPPLRPMSDDEQDTWTQRVPADSALPMDGERFSVWWARMDDEGSGWGVEAHTYSASGAPEAALFLVCRDAEDAADLARWLREHPTTEDMLRVHNLSQESAETGWRAAPEGRVFAIDEQAWAQALQRALPPGLGERMLASAEPDHPENGAWHELHALADEEVTRVGANPEQLAKVIARALGTWREVKRPAAAAHFVLTQAREYPRYADIVHSPAKGEHGTRSPRGTNMVVDGEFVIRPPRPGPGSSPEAALRWAHSLDPHSTEHRIMAKAEYTRWGPATDAELARKFPALVARSRDAARAEQRRRAAAAGEVPEGDSLADRAAAVDEDAAMLARYAEDVDRLDPSKPIDRRAALMMLGHVPPEIDVRIAEKFADDEQVTTAVRKLYPDGLPEAAAWRSRAEPDEARAAAAMATPDDPATPNLDEHAAAGSAAASERQVASAERAAATAALTAAPIQQGTTSRRRR